jgi:3-hydroxyacyl-CoA dehydrogenase/enoyl-CoA hydratase/3-hydroxybutyryl-CoA epimerase
VVEAVVEDMGIKKKIFSDIESRVSEDCLITSNTSSLSVTEMATVFKKPERFLGLHFFNPVNKMPLVEIITHDKVSQEAVQILHKWVVDNKKTPVVVKDGPGFLVNRILSPYLNEAAYLLEEGVSIDAIDKAALNFGMPMGPLRLMDEIGLDVAVKVGKIMHEGLGERMKPSELSKKLIETGLLGKKSNEGFYKYSDENNEGVVNNKLSEYLPAVSVDMDEVTIQMRLFLPMINEAAQVLEDGIVEAASDVDLGLIFGIGFPPFRGGPLRYADNEGADRIVTAIERFGTEVNGQRYQVCKFLKNIAEKSGRFYN